MTLSFAPDAIETWPLSRLQPYAKNAKAHGTDQLAKIAASMAEFGWTVPCLVGEDGELIAGHGRVLAATQLGLTEAPVIVLGHLTEAQRRAYRIADNKLTELGTWDEALLSAELNELLAEDFDLSLVGFSDGELDKLLAYVPEGDGEEGGAGGSVPPVTIPEPPRNPASRTGDLWILGDHRLLCGDSTSAADVRRLMNGERAILFATDPPYKDLRAWWSNPHYNRPGGVESGTPTAWAPQSKPVWFTELGCPAIDRGTNQPNVFFDPKSSESFTPHFSRGWRDDAIQRAYLEATYLWWGEAANNPVSSVYGGRMVHVPECAAWTWDARPYPFFPALTDVWTDGANWRLGHWLTGRLGAVSLAALVRHLCLRAGMPESRIDVTGLWGAVEGYAITALESPRASITTLSRHFGFDAVETEGVIRFVMRGRSSVATLTPDDLVAAREGDVLELTRGQETELPQALKWQVARADEDYDAALVEARRITVDTTRITSESFPMPDAEFEAILTRAAEEGAKRALADVGLDGDEAALDIRDLRSLVDCIRLVRRTAMQTAVRMITTGVMLALLAGIAIKLKIFGGGP